MSLLERVQFYRPMELGDARYWQLSQEEVDFLVQAGLGPEVLLIGFSKGHGPLQPTPFLKGASGRAQHALVEAGFTEELPEPKKPPSASQRLEVLHNRVRRLLGLPPKNM